MKKLLTIVRNKLGLILGIAAATVVGGVGGAIVMASVPDSSGVIHACYSTGILGKTRIIDSATTNCNNNETAITWNQQGPKGDTGATGATGATGPQGPAGTAGSDFVTNLVGADFTNSDLSYRLFAHRDLSNTTFNDTELRGADFTGTIFNGAHFNADQNVPVTDYKNTTFKSSDFSGATLDGGSLGVIRFINVDLTNAKFTGATLHRVQFNQSNLSGINMSGGLTLNTVQFYQSDLSNANFSNAHFIDADFEPTTTTGINLTGATWVNTYCKDGTNSDDNGGTCVGHF